MIGIRALLIAGCSVALCGTNAWATDFYVKPVTPGPVAGTPLGAVNLQASTAKPTDDKPRAFSKRLRTTVNERGNTAGKWLRSGSEQTGGASTTGGTTATTTQVSGTTAVTAPTTAPSAPAPSTSATPVTLVKSTSSSAGPAWNSVDELLKSGKVQGGDRILLMGGYYGALNIMNARFSAPVTIEAVPGQVAHAESMTVRASNNLVIQGLKIWALTENHPVNQIVRSYADASNITFNNMDVRAYKDSANYMNWSQATWLANQRSAFLLQGPNGTVQNSRVTGVYHGIQTSGANGAILNNIVDGFAGDGMRALGDNSLVQGNKLQNCFQINGNHADGFQSFTVDPVTRKAGQGVQTGLKIIGNKIVEWTSSSPNPLRCKLQGIGMFDGMFDDLVIQNNLIVSSAYHGIAVAGTRRTNISNNTVVNPAGSGSKYPHIKVSNDKDGTASSNVTIANNLANSVAALPAGIAGSTVTNNLVPLWSRDFTAPRTFNFSLTSGSPAADAATTKYAPKNDILLAPRPKGKGPDIGAYESR